MGQLCNALHLGRAFTSDLSKVPTPPDESKVGSSFLWAEMGKSWVGRTHLWAIPLSIFIDLSHGHVCIELILVFL